MAKKGNIISVNKLESVMRMDTTTIPMPGVEGVDIVVRHRLPLIEMMMFVDSIVTACVDDETGEYHPELFELASKECVLTMYANFRLPKDIEKMYDLLYNTDMVELVLDHVDEEQYRDIRVSAQKQIRHKLKVLESTAATRVNELVSYVQETIEKINEI